MHTVDVSWYHYIADSLADLWSPKLTEIECKGRAARTVMIHSDRNSVASSFK